MLPFQFWPRQLPRASSQRLGSLARLSPHRKFLFLACLPEFQKFYTKKPRPFLTGAFDFSDLSANSLQPSVLIPVVRWLVRTLGGDVEVLGLLLRELCELHSDLVEVEAGNFLVELLR